MTTPARPPATLRIKRPYATESDFVEGDLACFGRGTLILAGVASREIGELLRFELILSNGSPAFRGEANVVAHHDGSNGKPMGLEVRLTRMDARSKAILDRAREARASQLEGAGGDATHSLLPVTTGPADGTQSLLPVVPASSVVPIVPMSSVLPVEPVSAVLPVKPLAPMLDAMRSAVSATVVTDAAHPSPAPGSAGWSAESSTGPAPLRATTSTNRKVVAPPNRDEILERLRARAREMSSSGRLSYKKREVAG